MKLTNAALEGHLFGASFKAGPTTTSLMAWHCLQLALKTASPAETSPPEVGAAAAAGAAETDEVSPAPNEVFGTRRPTQNRKEKEKLTI